MKRFIYSKDEKKVLSAVENETTTYSNESISILVDEPQSAYVFFSGLKYDYSNVSELTEFDSIWHDDNFKIQIKMGYDDNLKMLSYYPEVAQYRKDNFITTIIENGFVYSYVNYLLDEHRILFENFNGKISER